MNGLVRSLVDYLHDTLGISLRPRKWDGNRSLPVFMQSTYDCYTASILNAECLLLVSRAEDDTTPAAMQKHHELACRKWTGPVVLVRRSIRSNDRQRLVVQYRLPFVVPGNQLYLPDLGLDLREHFREVRKDSKPFSPSTQVLVLRALLTGSYNALVSTELVRALPYTSMTMKRAFDEIEQAQVAATSMRGRERELTFKATGRELWDAALPFLRSPVRKRALVALRPDSVPALEAGITALSRYSMITAPVHSTVAISHEMWEAVKAQVGEVGYDDGHARLLEVWKYNPSILSVGSTVDRLSLFLSLRDTDDERVEGALDEMMENVRW